MMKKVRNYLVMATVALIGACAMTSCSNDDDANADDLVGTWLAIQSQGWEKENGKTIDSWDEDITDENNIIEFKSNGTVNVWEDDYLENSAKWSVSGSQIKITYSEDGEVYTEKSNFKINGNKLTIYFKEKYKEDGDSYEYYEETVYTRVK